MSHLARGSKSVTLAKRYEALPQKAIERQSQLCPSGVAPASHVPQNELALALLDVRGEARGAMGCGGSKEADAPTGVDAAAKSEGKKLALRVNQQGATRLQNQGGRAWVRPRSLSRPRRRELRLRRAGQRAPPCINYTTAVAAWRRDRRMGWRRLAEADRRHYVRPSEVVELPRMKPISRFVTRAIL